MLRNMRGYMVCLLFSPGFYKYGKNTRLSQLKTRFRKYGRDTPPLAFHPISVFFRKYENKQDYFYGDGTGFFPSVFIQRPTLATSLARSRSRRTRVERYLTCLPGNRNGKKSFCSLCFWRVCRFQQRLPCDLNLISSAQAARACGLVRGMLGVDQDLKDVKVADGSGGAWC